MTMDIEYDSSNPEIMKQYYSRLYPFKSVFTWLNHHPVPSRLFTHREFAFTLPGEVYLRYNSFNNAEDMKQQVCKFNPSRFEIGPIYCAKPRDKKTLRAGAFTPQLRELVLDIDMTDYDAIRTCCTGKGICKRCWGFISCAVKVLDTAFRETFDYKHLLWVYSGRRGIHCWISDKEAMELTDEQRKALMGWLEVIKGGKDAVKLVNIRATMRKNAQIAIHPYLQQALQRLNVDFPALILRDQNCFLNPAGWGTLLQLLPDSEVRLNLESAWSESPDRSSADKWEDIARMMLRLPNHEKATLKAALEDVVLQYTYPRLDAEVTKHRNHLLKAPFCVHPSTGRICVPVDPRKVDEFDPSKVPTIGQLLSEIDNAAPAADGQEEHHADWQKTSLRPYIEMLDEHARQLVSESVAAKRGTHF